MEDFWDILVPIMVIGGIFVSVFAENRKNNKRNTPNTQHAENFETVQPSPPQQPSLYVKDDDNKSTKTNILSRPRLKQDMPGDNIKHVTPQEDKAYLQEETGEADNAMNDIRRAMIAHEILKRKF